MNIEKEIKALKKDIRELKKAYAEREIQYQQLKEMIENAISNNIKIDPSQWVWVETKPTFQPKEWSEIK